MPRSDLDPALAQALSYFRDLGYQDTYLGGAPSGQPRSGQSRSGQAAPASAAAPGGQAAGDAPARARALAQLGEEAAGCTACRLAEGRTHVVFGTGDPDASLMFVGEGPGAHEDRQGLPFVGAAGQLLDKIIKAIGLERQDVYIANVVKCRPPENRDPKAEEVAACIGYLERQIELVQPKVIVALGRVAAQSLLGNDSSITRLRGAWHEVKGVPLRVTYHPAALLRHEGLKRPTWEDMQQVRDRLRAS